MRPNGIWSIAYGTERGTLASANADWTVSVWDIASGQQNARLNTDIDSNKSLAFSPNGRTLATNGYVSGGYRGLRLWDVSSGKLKTTLGPRRNDITNVAFSADGRTIISAEINNLASVWDVPSGGLKSQFTLDKHTAGVRSIAVSPDFGTFASASEDLSLIHI